MAYGRLAVAELTADTNTTLYTVSNTCYYSEININILNPTVTDSDMEVSITTNPSSISNSEYVEKAISIPANGGVLALENYICSPGESVVVKSSVSGVVVRVSGKEIIKA